MNSESNLLIISLLLTKERIPLNESISDSYRGFHRNVKPKLLTSRLHRVVEFEHQTFESLISGESLQSYHESTGLNKYALDDAVLSPDDIESIEIVYHEDSRFLDIDEFESEINMHAHIISRKGVYLGHIYTWDVSSQSDTRTVIGIRTSIANLYARSQLYGKGINGIALCLIDSIVLQARKEQFEYVEVLQPFKAMPYILTKYGFCEEGPLKNYLYRLTDTTLETTSIKIPQYEFDIIHL